MYSCALISKSPEKMIVLSNIYHRGSKTPIRIQVPAKYGDFSTEDADFSFNYAARDNHTGVIECFHPDKKILYQIFVMRFCPVPLVLKATFGMDKPAAKWKTEHWIYNGMVPVPSTAEKAKEFLMQEHRCL